MSLLNHYVENLGQVNLETACWGLHTTARFILWTPSVSDYLPRCTPAGRRWLALTSLRSMNDPASSLIFASVCAKFTTSSNMTSVTFIRGWVKMADSPSDDDMLRLLQIQTIAVAMQMTRKKKKAQRRFYMRSIFTQRKEHGDYHQLVRELELGDSVYYPRYIRMTPDILKDILWRVGQWRTVDDSPPVGST